MEKREEGEGVGRMGEEGSWLPAGILRRSTFVAGWLPEDGGRFFA